MSVEVRHGDCMEHMPTLRERSVDLVLTDPPYGMSYVSAWRKHRNTVTVPVAGDDAFDPHFHLMWAREAYRVLRDGGALYSFASDHHLGAFRQAFADAGFRVKRTLVWVKNAWTSGDLEGDYGHQTEFIVYATKERHTLAGGREGNVLDFRRVPPGDLQHSCQKPVPLLAYLMRKSCPPGGLVLDPFCGSGSTGVAALGNGYRFLGVEGDAAHVATARERTMAAWAQPSLLAEPAA